MQRFAAVALLLLASCATSATRCDTLYFGSLRPDSSPITAAEWDAFVRDTISPRFPSFTESEANGHWKSEHERTHVVFILHPASDDAAIAEIMAAYKRQFAQEAVLRVRTGCSSAL